MEIETQSYITNLLKINPKIVENNLNYNDKKFNKKKEYYQLKEHIDTFLEKESDDRFFIMPGLRGVGKTTIIYQLFSYLLNEKQIPKNRILYLNLENLKDVPNFNIKEYIDVFLKDVNEAYPTVKNQVFIFVDESQYSKNWASLGKIIFDEDKNVFMIFTGSDALNLEYNNDSARRSLKKEIYPLNFAEYLYLKYDINYPDMLSETFRDMIFTGKVKESQKIENRVYNQNLINLNQNYLKEWEYYIQYGCFPFTLNRTEESIVQLTLDMKDRIIEKDLDIITSFTTPIRLATYKLINIIAMSKPSELSSNKLSNILNISKTSIQSIFQALEKTHLLFHVEPYGSCVKRQRKSWEYYFLTSQIKASIYIKNGLATQNPKEYIANLSENLVAASLFKLQQNRDFGIFYDPEKGGVDFLLNTIMGDIIPIEVGIGAKNTKQVKKAISRYNSDYGIIVSNRSSRIQKEDNIISIPLSTFSFM